VSERIVLLDPSVPKPGGASAPNAGDEVIGSSVLREIHKLFPGATVSRITTHGRPTGEQLELIAAAGKVLIGGSNLLGNPVTSWKRPGRKWRQWSISLGDAEVIDRAILFGVGWRVYEDEVESSTRRLYRTALAQEGIHSVRDEYTRRKLQGMGFSNVVNTGCPTLWPLIEHPLGWIPVKRSRSVLTTVTDYRPSPSEDVQVQRLLAAMYDHVYLWPQGEGDAAYAKRINASIEILPSGLNSLDGFLEANDCDYVGTRLHGGIYCLNARRRALIIAVDNRAAEMGPETGLPTIERNNISGMRDWIEHPKETQISLNRAAIETWRGQFRP